MLETASDVLVEYLEQLGCDAIFGIPGGAIEPLFDALARSERRGGPHVVVARHESGAAYMADGYARLSGRLGVCCATTGPGATNLITGVASAYENHIPMLVLTAQTALKNHGRRAFQESADTGINVVGMMQHCTAYNTMVTHVDQFETKLVSAIMVALDKSLPTHISVPVDILRAHVTARMDCNFSAIAPLPQVPHRDALETLLKHVKLAKRCVFVVGAKCETASSLICRLAELIQADIVVTPDGKGLVNPRHPRLRGVVGFAGHSCAGDALANPEVDLVIAAGTAFSEWSSNGWDGELLLNCRLIHVDTVERNLTGSPMAKLHVRGDIAAVFEYLITSLDGDELNPVALCDHIAFDEYEAPQGTQWHHDPVWPPWLMRQLTLTFPAHTLYLADTGNSMAWAIQYLHPHDRRASERRSPRVEDPQRFAPGRRQARTGLFQTTIEFSAMGWAIGAAIGAAVARPDCPIACLTGDGSWLMNGQEVTVALQHQLPVVFIILNDAALGMVKHGQRIAGAEPIGCALPKIDYAAMATAMGIRSLTVATASDWAKVQANPWTVDEGPLVLDIHIQPEAVPPIGMRMKVLSQRPD